MGSLLGLQSAVELNLINIIKNLDDNDLLCKDDEAKKITRRQYFVT